MVQIRRLVSGPRYDCNIFLETIDARRIPHARVNCLLPNPEFFRDENRSAIAKMDWILCKTRHAEAIFVAMGCRCFTLGFTGEDRRDPDVVVPPDRRRFLHVAGASSWKGTAAVMSAWARHPEWPTLTLVYNPVAYGAAARRLESPGENVRLVTGPVADEQLRLLQNQHLVHVCPSEVEGFGHVIAEAMSCGAIVVTTDAPPMNELVTPERGFLVRCATRVPMGLTQRCVVDPNALARVIEAVLDLADSHVAQRRAAARGWFEENDRRFGLRLSEFLERVREGPRMRV